MADFILTEDGNYLLQETVDKIILEQSSGGRGMATNRLTATNRNLASGRGSSSGRISV